MLMWWVDPGWTPGAHQAVLSLPSAGQGRKNIVNSLWVEIRTGRDHSQLPSWAKQTRLGKINLSPVKSE